MEAPRGPSLKSHEVTLDSVDDVIKVMKVLFGGKSAELYRDYAQGLCLLSDAVAARGALTAIDRVLLEALNEYLGTTYQAHQAWVMAQCDEIVCDGYTFRELKANAPGLRCYKVSVSKLLKRCFAKLGVTQLLLDTPCAVFADAQSKSFVPLVRKGCLFVDGVTNGHGEFTHTLQWMMIAAANQGGDIQLSKDVGELYKKAVDIATASEMLLEKAGTLILEEKSMWDVVLDCFLLTNSQTGYLLDTDPHDLGRSLFALNLRCPRLLQYALFGRVGDARFSNAEGFVADVNLPDAAPLLCALLANRHRNKGLSIDVERMKENAFRSYYSDHALEKAKVAAEREKARQREAHKKATAKAEDFLEDTTGGERKEPRFTFNPLGNPKPKGK